MPSKWPLFTRFFSTALAMASLVILGASALQRRGHVSSGAAATGICAMFPPRKRQETAFVASTNTKEQPSRWDPGAPFLPYIGLGLYLRYLLIPPQALSRLEILAGAAASSGLGSHTFTTGPCSRSELTLAWWNIYEVCGSIRGVDR